MDTNAQNAQQWLTQIANGDEAAYKALFDMYWDHIYSVAFVLTKSVTLSEDMVQEIFLKIWLKRKELANIDKLENYLFVIARNHIYNELKKQQRDVGFKKQILKWFESSNTTPEQELLYKESSKLLQQAVEKLSKQQQLIYKMTREQGLSHDQVAKELNISVNTVRNHIVNSLKIIREYLSEHASPVMLIVVLLKTLS